MSIVADIKREGLAAVLRNALELDGIELALAGQDEAALPREALLQLVGRTRSSSRR
jgi:hypothetical protein